MRRFEIILMFAMSLWLAPILIGFDEMQLAPDIGVEQASSIDVDPVHPLSPGVHTGLFM
jgi:hypothetical protein